ncbi:hypothetical protein [Streptomyces malaysiensis]|uniref:Uncharacterized protein n=1 Tax=Streptomyces malaysiensis TaxID=92644 RepID=A0A7X5X7F0_STRMQ|nr:hypothetical protein [Streptomyces malaysiensis]NIY68024.1 hypothetical protein [Streptomyces malaysiensis]
MSDFWLNKIRESQGPAPRPQAGLTPAGTPWWANPTYTHPEPQPQAPQSSPDQLQRAYRTERAQSAHHHERCPSCGSEHYWRPTPNAAAQCFDCGWPVQNSTQGVAVANNSSAPTRKSLHEVKGSGYRPDVIVGRM